jgi:hypothetical protein
MLTLKLCFGTRKCIIYVKEPDINHRHFKLLFSLCIYTNVYLNQWQILKRKWIKGLLSNNTYIFIEITINVLAPVQLYKYYEPIKSLTPSIYRTPRAQYFISYYLNHSSKYAYTIVCCVALFLQSTINLDNEIINRRILDKKNFWNFSFQYNKKSNKVLCKVNECAQSLINNHQYHRHRCFGRVGSPCSTSDTHRVNLVINPVISHEWG